ncbi:hypothetical protein LINGRAHAP2_LOCUS22694 [Linum grandiflorum]
MAASRFQAASLVGVPSYPNAIAWSDDNFIAVASGHIVTILNPALPCGPRGTITVSTGKHYSIGRVVKEGWLPGSRFLILSDALTVVFTGSSFPFSATLLTHDIVLWPRKAFIFDSLILNLCHILDVWISGLIGLKDS